MKLLTNHTPIFCHQQHTFDLAVVDLVISFETSLVKVKRLFPNGCLLKSTHNVLNDLFDSCGKEDQGEGNYCRESPSWGNPRKLLFVC